MEPDTKQRVEMKVREILETVDMDTATELKVREMAAESLGVGLSDIVSKKLVREIVEAYLLSTIDDDGPQIRVHGVRSDGKENANGNLNLVGGSKESREQPEKASEIPAKRSGDDDIRFLCKLSNKRSVAVTDSAGEKVVLVGEFLWKDGKRVPGSRGIGLTADQWLTFRKSFPDIEEAIRKVKSQIRLEVERKPTENVDKSDSHPTTAEVRFQPQLKKHNSDNCPAQEVAQNQIHKNVDKPDPRPTTANFRFQPKLTKHKSDTCPAEEAAQNQIHKNPIAIVRFDGKNYHDWARRMEPFLEQLKLAYVLTDPCPTAVGAQKWMDDDYICRSNILSSLSDNLFDVFSKKSCTTAKELWDELKLVYLTAEHGSKVSLVKKYMEFQMVEGKSVVAQAQELHELADSFTSLGMHVQEVFHVNAIISKLPASWKDVGVRLMRENNLPAWMLTNALKHEEELRKRGKRGLFPAIAVDRERKVWFCSICERKGHSEEKCRYKDNKFERGKSSTGVPQMERRDHKQV